MSKKNEYTKAIPAAMGFLGLLGLTGFIAFPVFKATGMTFPFLFFGFFGFFGFFFSAKMSKVLIDERYIENRSKAFQKASRLLFTVVCILTVLISALEAHIDATICLIIVEVIIGLTVAAYNITLEYLTYKYDTFEEEE